MPRTNPAVRACLRFEPRGGENLVVDVVLEVMAEQDREDAGRGRLEDLFVPSLFITTHDNLPGLVELGERNDGAGVECPRTEIDRQRIFGLGEVARQVLWFRLRIDLAVLVPRVPAGEVVEVFIVLGQAPNFLYQSRVNGLFIATKEHAPMSRINIGQNVTDSMRACNALICASICSRLAAFSRPFAPSFSRPFAPS
jgi:hypothetical protein